MHKQTITERIQELQEKCGIRRTKQMVADTRNDYIRKQMEVYKEKSRMLQQMMASQEALTKELQVMEQEIEAQRREAEVRQQEMEAEAKKKRSAELGQLSADNHKLEKQIEQLTENMGKEMEQLTGQFQNAVDELAQRILIPLEELKGTLNGIQNKPEEGRTGMQEELKDVKEDLDVRLDLMREGLTDKLDALKGDLSEKVHHEGVKCFRNVQSLVHETKEEVKAEYFGQDAFSDLRRPLRWAIGFGIVNLVLIVALGLLELGVFNSLF